MPYDESYQWADEPDNSTADDDALLDSSRTEQWGFTRDLPTNFTQSSAGPQDALLSIMRLASSRARSWVIQLLPMKYYATQPGVTQFPQSTSAIPLDGDHYTESMYFGEVRAGNPAIALQPFTPLRVRLQWGVGNVADSCVMDYPARGGAIQICASYLQLFVEQYVPNIAPNGLTPRIGGFIVPNTAAPANDAGYSCRPTYTYTTQPLLVGATEYVPIPNRAMAYRANLFGAIDNGGAGDRPALQQWGSLGWNLSILATDDAGTALATTNIPVSRSQWVFPLDSRAQAVLVGNTDGVATHQYSLQFLLDLGA